MVNTKFLTAFVLLVSGPVSASTFTLDVTGACGLSAPTISSTTGLNETGAQQCNNLTGVSTGNLLGSRNVAFEHNANFDGIQSAVSAITSTTDVPSSGNTGASVRIDTTNATDTLSFLGGPSEFELLVTLDYTTEVRSTVSSATFMNFSLGVQRLGGSGGQASDSFRVTDYATAVSQEVFNDDPIRILINNGARVNLNAALTAQATVGSIAGQNDNDEALARGDFQWSFFVPNGVRISASSGFDYNQSQISAVPLPAGGLLLLSSLGLIALSRRRQSS